MLGAFVSILNAGGGHHECLEIVSGRSLQLAGMLDIGETRSQIENIYVEVGRNAMEKGQWL